MAETFVPRSILAEFQLRRRVEGLIDGRVTSAREVEFQQQDAEDAADRKGEECQHDEAQFVMYPGRVEAYRR